MYMEKDGGNEVVNSIYVCVTNNMYMNSISMCIILNIMCVCEEEENMICMYVLNNNNEKLS